LHFTERDKIEEFRNVMNVTLPWNVIYTKDVNEKKALDVIYTKVINEKKALDNKVVKMLLQDVIF